MYFVYILKCKDDTLYTGVTTDLTRRVNEHNGVLAGKKGAKYTEGRRPVTLVYHEAAKNRSIASARESAIKRMTRAQKLRLF